MDYDIIVIGAGSGGLNIAVFMNLAGFKTLLIDKKDRAIGGDCLNHGCVPSKALIHVAKLAKHAKDASKFGLKSSGSIDLRKALRYVSRKKEHIREHENAAYFRKQGMDVELGHATFSGPRSVRVGKKEFSAKRIVIATGSRPRRLNIPGIENATVYTNEEIFDIKEMPKRLIVVGGGPIGCELGQSFSRLGSQVTILQRGSEILPKETPEAAQILREQLISEGVIIRTNTSPVRVDGKNKLIVSNNGKESSIRFDAILVSIGRELNHDKLDIEKAGVRAENGRLIVDKYLRTTNKNVLAIGDVAGGYQFTHAAELHAKVILGNFFSPFKKKVNYDKFSWVTYTDPEIATFGINENDLKKRGIPYTRYEQDFGDVDRGITDDAKGQMILFIGKKDKILGGTLIAPGAGELIQEMVLANTLGIGAGAVFGKIWAYPTAARVNKKIIGQHRKKSLTPFVKKLFRWLY